MPYDLTASILFVDEHGSLLEKARLLRILMNEPPSKAVYEKLLSLQNADGGFPSRPRAGSASSVDSTLTALWQLDELGMFETPPARRALGFLVAMQRAYGGWDENPGLPAHDLPPWIRPGETATRMYLSAYAAYWLGLGGQEYQDAFQKAVAFLAAWQGPSHQGSARQAGMAHQESTARHPGAKRKDAPAAEVLSPAANAGLPASAAANQNAPLAPGQLPGYLHNNWLGTAAFLMAGPAYAQNARLGLDYLLSRPLAGWEDSQIAWALDCLVHAGLPAKHPFIQYYLPVLRQRRASDGSWASEDGPAFAAAATVGAIKVLTKMGG